MAKKKELKEIVLERRGKIVREGCEARDKPWVKYSAADMFTNPYDEDIACAAIRAGYKVGDEVIYRITVVPKR